MGGATLPVAVLRRRGCMGRFAPLPDAGRAPRGAAPPERAVGRAGALRGAAARRPDDADGDAGFRAAGAPDDDRTADDFAAGRPDVVPGFLAAAPGEPFAAEPFPATPLAAEPLAAAPFPAAPLAAEPLAAAPFAVGPDGFFDAALPFAGVVPLAPLAPFAPEEPAPEPERGVDDGRAPEPRAEPEGRAGRREEGMGRLCRFADPLYRHYPRRAVCRNRGMRKSAPTKRSGIRFA
ncbi:hypothetical protein C8K30_11385 [Promicromonospora sp. AC04]|nr:hypothetical protein C8K30_11385 [Promicromonospora sp. AC04]